MIAASRLGAKLKPYVEKARESALLAVEVYNKPGTNFKSAAYISLMVIAWTSLFHAIFLKNGKKPYKKKKNGRFEKVDGDYRHWELADCLRNYSDSDVSNAARKNLELFIPLRNKIEHRQLPELDGTIFGECQALLLNFDALLGKHFGVKRQLREVLSFSLQIFPSSRSFLDVSKKCKNAKEIRKFIENYRSCLASDVSASEQFAFKAYLIQVANHQSADAMPIQFIHSEQLSQEQRQQLKAFTVAVKWRNPSVSNAGMLKAKSVVQRVADSLGKKFTIHMHALSWKRYGVRPIGGAKKPEETKTKYCVYDELHGDYVYTRDWVEFLINKLSEEHEYDALTSTRGVVSKTPL